MIEGNIAEAEPAELASARHLLADLSKARDFPALSQVVSKVNRIANSETSRADELTESVLKDISLTTKLLRVVNSVHYKRLGSGPVNTVSRAIVLLGYDTVRDTALSLMLFDHLANHAQAATLKGEAVESFYCGILGRAMAHRAGLRDCEEVRICALFRNLGRMMCRLHFYEKSNEVEVLTAEQKLPEETASRRVFGVSYDEFGLAIGRHWNLPGTLLDGMAPLPSGSAQQVGTGVSKVQVLANMARDLYVATRDTSTEKTKVAYSDLLKRYGKVVPLQTGDLEELVYQASCEMEKESVFLQVDVRSSKLLKRLLDRPHTTEGESESRPADDLEFTDTFEAEAEDDGHDAASVLITGMQDMTNLILEGAKPADVLHVTAELLYRSRCFDNVLICTIATSGMELVGRIGFGPHTQRSKAHFRIPLAFEPDVFHVAVSKNVDLLIADTHADSIRNRIPAWFYDKVGSRSFLLLPLTLNQKTVALIYGDRIGAELELAPQTLNLIKAMRNQVTLALRQKQ